jgi:hypothetical protein
MCEVENIRLRREWGNDNGLKTRVFFRWVQGGRTCASETHLRDAVSHFRKHTFSAQW